MIDGSGGIEEKMGRRVCMVWELVKADVNWEIVEV